MRLAKTLFFSALMALVTQFAVAQGHDAFPTEHADTGRLVKIFPNPAVDFLNVKFETPKAKSIKLTLHNIIGNIMEVESEVIDEYEIRLRVKDLPTGVYVLAVKEDGAPQNSFKFLKR
jgi:hypothetical protein